MAEPRYHLYVKAGRGGACLGDCPFSQRANMYCRLKGIGGEIKMIFIDLSAKPEYFLKLNPSGTVPVFVDTQADKTITDSAEISDYLNKVLPESEMKAPDAEAVDAISGLLPKFFAFMKNKDKSAEESLKAALMDELKKINDYLKKEGSRGKFLVCDALCELDCQILPRLRHVQVAGKHYKGLEIPEDFKALWDYIGAGESHEVFRATCPPDEEFVHGWKRLLV